MPQSSTAQRLAQGEVATSPGIVYTTDDANRAILSCLSLHNASVGSRVVAMWIVPAGETQTDSNKFLSVTLQAGDSYRESGLGQVLEAGDTIYMSSTDQDVAYHLSGAVLIDV